MQTASAFASVQGALSFFVSVYRQLAEWRAVVDRLDGFEARDCERARACNRPTTGFDRHRRRPATARSTSRSLRCNCRTARRWSPPTASAFAHGERTLMTGPSGSGKSTLFRAIAGIWPFGDGRDHRSRRRNTDDAAAAAVFPDRIAARGDRLSRRGRQLHRRPGQQTCSRRWACRSWRRGWTRRRTGTACCRSASSSVSGWRARCCKRRTICSSTRRPPRSTSLRRRRCTGCLRRNCRHTTIVSIGHRSTLDAFHQRNVRLARDGDRFALQDGKLSACRATVVGVARRSQSQRCGHGWRRTPRCQT